MFNTSQQAGHGRFMQTVLQSSQANSRIDKGTPSWAANLFQQYANIQHTVDSQNTRGN